MEEKLQFENEKIKLYGPDSLNFITEKIPKVLSTKIDEYKEFFGVENFRKMKVTVFDDLEKFRDYVYSLRGKKEPIPEYSRGVFENGDIILCFDELETLHLGKDIYEHKIDLNAYTKEQINRAFQHYMGRIKVPSHETFHIMYQELVWGKIT